MMPSLACLKTFMLPLWRPPRIKSTGFDWSQRADHIPVLSCVHQTLHGHTAISGFYLPFPILLCISSLPPSFLSFLYSFNKHLAAGCMLDIVLGAGIKR